MILNVLSNLVGSKGLEIKVGESLLCNVMELNNSSHRSIIWRVTIFVRKSYFVRSK